MADTLHYDGDVVVITGAGNGLGRAYALELARRGARVVVNDLGGTTDGKGSDASAASRVVAEIKAAGGEAVENFDSVATAEGGANIIATALKTYGRIDAVISNAGILRDKSFAKMGFPDIDAVMDVHLRGAFYVLQPAFVAMKDSGRGGRLLLTTSASGLYGNFGQANYTAAKMGVVGLMRTLAIEGRKSNILVNAISPVAGTRLAGGVEVQGGAPLDPAHIAPLAVALTHAKCPTTGEIFLATGGWYARTAMLLGSGWSAPSAAENTAENLIAHFNSARDLSSVSEPPDAMSIAELMKARVHV